MAYGDGLFVIGHQEWTDITGEGMTNADVWEVNADDAAQDLWTFRSPFIVQIEAFGLIMTEIDAAPSTAPVLSLDWVTADAAATRTEILSLTVDAPLYAKGDGKKASATVLADADLTIGSVILYTGTALPFRLTAGQLLVAEHKTAGDGSTGAYQVFALARIEGYDLTATNVATLLAAA